MNRRSFLKFASAAPAAAALGGQELAKMAVGPGVSTGLVTSLGAAGQAMINHGNIGSEQASMVAWFVKNGFPEFVKQEAREQARFVHSLDPDLAVNRSMSLPAKIAIQRQRNYENILSGRDPVKSQERGQTRNNFFERFGFHWW